MPLREKSQIPIGNRILSALPFEEYARLSSYMEPVRLPSNRILYRAGDAVRHVYFPRGGLLSLLSVTQDGDAVEVGVVGNEGVMGLQTILRGNVTPYQVVVQLHGNAIRIPAEVLRVEFDRGRRLQDMLLRYTNTLVIQLSQSAACNRFHSMRGRLCRWLLVCYDHTRGDTLDFTHEFLSRMIGAPRPRVSVVARSLQQMGMIDYSRGRIRVVDRQRLEAASCECYRIVRVAMDHFLAA